MAKYHKALAGIGSTLLGLAIGVLFFGEKAEVRSDSDSQPDARSGRPSEIPRYRDLSDYMESEFSYVEDLETFAEKIASMHSSSHSPIRAQVVTSAYIENGSFEEWHERVKNGEIAGKDLLQMVAAYFVREDAARAMEMMLNGPYDFQSFADLLTFGAALTQEAAVVDPAAGFTELHKKEPNLHRQVLAKWFSDQLARKNPALAAERFSEILELRDHGEKGNEQFTRTLLESWRKTDQPAMVEFINGLPEGEVRELFEGTFSEIQN